MKLNLKSRAARRGGVAVLTAAVLVALTGCTERLPSGQAEVVYHGGHHAKDFKKCIPAGTNGGVGVNDATYRYPVNGRDFQFMDNTNGAERGSIQVLSSDGLTMTVSGAVYFTINDDCDVLQKFHELVGTTMGAQDGRTDGVGALTDDAWNRMLVKYIGVPVENALDRVTLSYSSQQLVGDAKAKNEWQQAAAAQIVQSIKQVTGGEPYFCKPNFQANKKPNPDTCGEFSIQLNQAKPPAELAAANADKAAAVARAASQQAQANSQKDLITLYGVQGYLQLQQLQLLRDAMNKGNIPFLPVPAGGTINYTPAK